MNLYRKHRPQTFAELVGQSHISETLLHQLESGKIAHAYLFSGPRGTGKTSTARIFAKAINCKNNTAAKFGEPCNKCENCLAIADGRYLDVIEIDAASNRGIDEIRDLREKINLAPMAGKYKVYIIDESHQLTSEAFNALLKTLEEPPAHAVFILATTEAHKIPATILSRVQKFDFGKAARGQIEEKLKRVVKKENAKISDESLSLISKLAEGSYRDAEVLLEKVVSANASPKDSEVEKILGYGKSEDLLSLLDLLLLKKTKEAIFWFSNYLEKGGHPKVFLENFIELLREVLLLKVGALSEKESSLAPENFTKLSTFSSQINHEKLSSWISLFTSAVSEMQDSPIPSLPIELAIVEACDFQTNISDTLAVGEDINVETKKNEEIIEEKPAEIIIEPVEEKKVKKTKNGEITIEGIQNNWTEVLKKVKPHNNSLEIFLRGAIPIEIEEDLITLEVSYVFHKDRLEESKNNTIITTVLSEVLGRPVRIKGKVAENRPKTVRETEAQIEEVDPVEIFGKLV